MILEQEICMGRLPAGIKEVRVWLILQLSGCSQFASWGHSLRLCPLAALLRLPSRVKVRMVSSAGELDGVTLQMILSWTCVGLDTESSFQSKNVLLQVGF